MTRTILEERKEHPNQLFFFPAKLLIKYTEKNKSSVFPIELLLKDGAKCLP